MCAELDRHAERRGEAAVAWRHAAAANRERGEGWNGCNGCAGSSWLHCRPRHIHPKWLSAQRAGKSVHRSSAGRACRSATCTTFRQLHARAASRGQVPTLGPRRGLARAGAPLSRRGAPQLCSEATKRSLSSGVPPAGTSRHRLHLVPLREVWRLEATSRPALTPASPFGRRDSLLGPPHRTPLAPRHSSAQCARRTGSEMQLFWSLLNSAQWKAALCKGRRRPAEPHTNSNCKCESRSSQRCPQGRTGRPGPQKANVGRRCGGHAAAAAAAVPRSHPPRRLLRPAQRRGQPRGGSGVRRRDQAAHGVGNNAQGAIVRAQRGRKACGWPLWPPRQAPQPCRACKARPACGKPPTSSSAARAGGTAFRCACWGGQTGGIAVGADALRSPPRSERRRAVVCVWRAIHEVYGVSIFWWWWWGGGGQKVRSAGGIVDLMHLR